MMAEILIDPSQLQGFAAGATPGNISGFRTLGSLADYFNASKYAGYSPYASGNRGEGTGIDYNAVAAKAATESGFDPNAKYAYGGVGLNGGTGHTLYRQEGNQWNPVYSRYAASGGAEFSDWLKMMALTTGAVLAGGTLMGGSIAGGLSGAGGSLGAAEAGTAAGTAGTAAKTSADVAALYGPEAYGVGMTGAETAAYDAAISSGMTAGEALDYVKKGYNYYNKGKQVLGMLGGGGEQQGQPGQGAPQAGKPGGLSGGDTSLVGSGLNRSLLGNPRLGAAQAQQADYLRRSYAPVAQEEQQRKLKGLLAGV